MFAQYQLSQLLTSGVAPSELGRRRSSWKSSAWRRAGRARSGSATGLPESSGWPPPAPSVDELPEEHPDSRPRGSGGAHAGGHRSSSWARPALGVLVPLVAPGERGAGSEGSGRPARAPRAGGRAPQRAAARDPRTGASRAHARSWTGRPTRSSRSTRPAASSGSMPPAAAARADGRAVGRTCGDVLGCAVAGGHGDVVPLAEVLASGQSIAYRETAIRGAGGGSIRVAGGYSRAPSGPGGPIRATAILRDISAVRALEQLREGFVATVSHELRTPLALIRGYAETILHLDLEPRPGAPKRGPDPAGHQASRPASSPDPRHHPPGGRPAHPRTIAGGVRVARRPAVAATSRSRARQSAGR